VSKDGDISVAMTVWLAQEMKNDDEMTIRRYDEGANHSIARFSLSWHLMSTPPLRSAYLLTLWRERPARSGQPAVWRFSLEDVQTRERRGFADLDALTAFLKSQMANVETTPDDCPSS